MNKENADNQNEINGCKLIYNGILIAVLLLPLVMYAIYLPMRDNPLLLLGIPLCSITFFIVSGMQKDPCENVEEKRKNE